jgi:hypothetical protein
MRAASVVPDTAGHGGHGVAGLIGFDIQRVGAAEGILRLDFVFEGRPEAGHARSAVSNNRCSTSRAAAPAKH